MPDAATKARRLLTEGRPDIQEADDKHIKATCRGDSAALYNLGFERGRWWCSCPAVRCSHLLALQLVVVRPHGEQQERAR